MTMYNQNMAGPPPPGGGGFMNAQAPHDNRPKVVILGAGYAGAHCANTLQKLLQHNIDLVVVEKRKASVHKVGAARAAVLGNTYSDRVLIPNDALLHPGLGKMIHESVVQVREKEVQLASGVVLPFDYLVCATGGLNFSICEPPLRYTDRNSMKKFYDKVAKKIRSSGRIIIVGGGPVGCELAGEIKYEYHNKVVTIVHSGHKLCSRLSPKPNSKFFTRLKERLTDIGVDLKLGQLLQVNWNEHGNKPYISGENEYMTDKGERLQADLVLLCAGKKISNSFYPQDWLDPLTGQMKVKRTLQHLQHKHIFAIGDINDIPENKQAVFAGRQGDTCGANIAKLIQGKTSLSRYTPGFGFKRTFIFVAIGRKKGTAYLGFFTFGSSVVRKFKAKDLLTKETWKDFNVDNVPQEVGGPSKGNKLGTVSTVPNLMGENKALNLRTRSMEDRHRSVESSTSLADMYSDEELDSSMLKRGPPQGNFGEVDPRSAANNTVNHNGGPGTTQQFTRGRNARNDVVSFVGTNMGRGESVNFKSPAMKSPALIMAPTPGEYDKQRQATMERSGKSNNNTSNQNNGGGGW